LVPGRNGRGQRHGRLVGQEKPFHLVQPTGACFLFTPARKEAEHPGPCGLQLREEAGYPHVPAPTCSVAHTPPSLVWTGCRSHGRLPRSHGGICREPFSTSCSWNLAGHQRDFRRTTAWRFQTEQQRHLAMLLGLWTVILSNFTRTT